MKDDKQMGAFGGKEYVFKQYKDASNFRIRQRIWEHLGMSMHDWHRWIFEHIHLDNNAAVLELGSGSGDLWKENLERIPKDWQVTLSDISSGMLEEARNALDKSAHPFYFEVVDAESIPFKDSSFDAVIANLILYHVSDVSKALSEIRRVLKPNGRLYAATTRTIHVSDNRSSSMAIGWASSAFSLDNARQQLEAWFSKVKLYRWERPVVLDTAQTVAELFCSLIGVSSEDKEAYQHVSQRVEEEFSKGRGTLKMEFGLFVAEGSK
jgi:ubiquinone/menaquinone biosynthesis C-methylase UbiE